MVKPTDIFHDDGRIKGISLLKKSGHRNTAISIAVVYDGNRCDTSYAIRNGNLTEAFGKTVERLAEFYGIGQRTKLFKDMSDSLAAFANHYSLKLRQVTFEQIVE